MEGYNVWWFWKVPMLSGQWKEKEKEKHIFTSSHFPPTFFT
jgi:hypothetical protein